MGGGCLHDGGSRRRADRLDVIVLQPASGCGEGVQVGGVDDVGRVAVHLRVVLDVRESVVVRQEEDQVRLRGTCDAPRGPAPSSLTSTELSPRSRGPAERCYQAGEPEHAEVADARAALTVQRRYMIP